MFTTKLYRVSRPAWLLATLVLGLAFNPGEAEAQPTSQGPRKAGLVPGHFDVRVHGRSALTRPLRQDRSTAAPLPSKLVEDRVRAMRTAIARLHAGSPGIEVRLSPLTGGTELLRGRAGALTAPAPGRAGPEIALDFLRAHARVYGLTPTEVDALRVLGESRSPRSGLRMVRLEQTLHALPVFQSQTRVLLDGDGRLVRTVGRLVPALSSDLWPLPSEDGISAAEALAAAMRTVGLEVDAGAARLEDEGGRIQVTVATPEITSPVPSWRVYFPLGPGRVVLGWAQVAFTRGAGDWYTVVAARDGTLLYRKNVRDQASTEEARFSVYVQADGSTPADSPAPASPVSLMPGDGTQFPTIARGVVLMSAAQDTGASPDGWIPDGGSTTTGNNVDAYLDTDGDDQPDLLLLDSGGRPRGNPDAASNDRDFLGTSPRDFDFTPPPLLGNPDQGDGPALTSFRRGAVSQLFYVANWFHDRLFDLGFDEAAGNFQSTNFSGMGLAGDPVRAEAQHGASADGAFFATAPDGMASPMKVGLFVGPNPDRDAGLDAAIVMHELAHGLSNRLIGDAAGLNWLQGRAMGEGWSDFYALALLNATPADDPDGQYPAGAYATYRYGGSGLTDNYLYAIRRFPYTTDNAINPLTWADVDDTTDDLSGGISPNPLGLENGGANEVHNAGELWALSLWEVRSRIIAQLGDDVPAGNAVTLQLVTDALKMTPDDPTYVDARDALLDADCATNGCAHEAAIWAGFADRGLGYGAATSAGISTHYGVRESFESPFLDVAAVTVDDGAGNGNGAIDPGETISITVELTNPWRGVSENVAGATAVITGPSEVTVTDGFSSYGAIPAGGSATGDPFTFDVDPAAACGQSLPFFLATTAFPGVATFSLRVGAAAGSGAAVALTRMIPGGLPIPDDAPAGVTDAMFVTEDLEILDLDFRLDSLSHPWVGDLTVELKGPGGFGTDLVYRLAGSCSGGPLGFGANCGDDFTDTILDDSSANDLFVAPSSAAPFTGDWLPVLNSPALPPSMPTDPVGQLSRFNGSGTWGTWNVFVSDLESGDAGTLDSWSLLVTPRSFTCSSFSSEIFSDGFETGDTSRWSTTVP